MARLWSITAYFNPCRYRSRLVNYWAFRERLHTPLIVVELTFDGAFELSPDAADIVIRKHGADVMWQKERLLNIALEYLPDECREVAWLDCDILFAEASWPQRAVDALEEVPLIQPFSFARDRLARDSEALGPPAPGFAAAYSTGSSLKATFEYDSHGIPQRRVSAPGFAWAAKRALIESTRFYDACVLGAGDRALSQAAIGEIAAEIAARMPSPSHAAHYRRWAGSFHRATAGGIGCIPGEIIHLWHGAYRDRQYRVRFETFRRFDFDPDRDIELDGQSCWRWATDKPALHAYARELFRLRREDDPPLGI